MSIPAGPDPLVAGHSYATPSVDVYPFDETTAVTLEIRPPSGDPYAGGTPVASEVTADVEGTATVVQRWTAPPVAVDVPGYWVFAWPITGTGADVVEERFFVEPSPQPGGPTWVPTRERVATYIPERTVEIDRLSDGRPVCDFTRDTRPSDRQINMQIEDAVGWIVMTCGDIDATLHEAARGLCALRAAGMAELSWPVRDGDINAGQALLTQADNALKALKTRNDLLTTAPVDPDQSALLPVYSFPAPSPYGDYTF